MRRVPSLHLSSPSTLPLILHPSASNITFGSFTGDVGGSFNITKSLIIKTITGDIDTDVTVVPPFRRHKHERPPHRGEPDDETE